MDRLKTLGEAVVALILLWVCERTAPFQSIGSLFGP